MTAWLAALALASLAPAAAEGRVDPGQFQVMVDEVLADPEYRHLARFRDGERSPDEPSPSTAREARPGPQATSGPKPEKSEPGWAPSFQFPDLSGLVGLLRLAVFAALGVALLGIVFLVLQRLKRGPDAEALPTLAAGAIEVAESSPGEQEPDECRRQAAALARAGRYREAIRLLLLGAMSVIDRRGLVRHREGLTNGDYLRAVRREPPLRSALESIILAFDETHFGRRDANAERYEDCLRHYLAGFRA